MSAGVSSGIAPGFYRPVQRMGLNLRACRRVKASAGAPLQVARLREPGGSARMGAQAASARAKTLPPEYVHADIAGRNVRIFTQMTV